MADETFTPGTLWMMGTWTEAPNPTPEMPDVPIITLLMFRFCKDDDEKFEELTNIVDAAFEAGRAYEKAEAKIV